MITQEELGALLLKKLTSMSEIALQNKVLTSQFARSKKGRGGGRQHTILAIINAKTQRRKDARAGKAVAGADYAHKTVNGGRVNKHLVFFAPSRLCVFALKPLLNSNELEAGLGSLTRIKQRKIRVSLRRLLQF
jgi:hypothetical protein